MYLGREVKDPSLPRESSLLESVKYPNRTIDRVFYEGPRDLLLFNNRRPYKKISNSGVSLSREPTFTCLVQMGWFVPESVGGSVRDDDGCIVDPEEELSTRSRGAV